MKGTTTRARAVGLALLLAAACGGAEQPGIPLPTVGRAVRYALDDGPLDGRDPLDVLEVDGTEVRLREGLCDPDEPGFVVDWRDVKAWDDVGPARGDDRFYGIDGYDDFDY